jgi:hypothetical protein
MGSQRPGFICQGIAIFAFLRDRCGFKKIKSIINSIAGGNTDRFPLHHLAPCIYLL